MARYKQTIARIGFAGIAFCFLAWVLWPSNPSSIFQHPEPLVAFIVALVSWLAAEFKLSEEVVYRGATQNDIRVARTILSQHSEQLRSILYEHDWHNTISPELVTEVGRLINAWEYEHFSFQKKKLLMSQYDFFSCLDEFYNKVVKYTVPYQFPGGLLASVRPPNETDDFDIPDRYKQEIQELNRRGSKAWEKLEKFVAEIKAHVPEALDVPLTKEWLSR